MSEPVSITIVNVGYRSTNYWVVSAGTSRLLVDLAWPGTMGMMRASLKRMDVPIEEIRYALATHPTMIAQEDPEVVAASWELLRQRGARHVYPAHGPVRSIHE